MFDYIEKRDGSQLDFNADKITAAIAKAGKATSEFDRSIAKKLMLKALTLANKICIKKVIKVEDIQDVVERVLLDSSFFKTAKAYILYREQHAQLRNMVVDKNIDLVDDYLGKLDWKVKENSNMTYSLQGLNNYISADITAKYWLNKIYPPNIRAAHENADIHIHDLSLLSVYCVGWDLIDILENGFKGVKGKIESAPPKHFKTALGQIVNFFYTLQGEAAGAQALSNFDTFLAPFIFYDKLNYEQTKQAVQEFVFNINIPTRVGFQTPFTNITLDLKVPSFLINEPVIIGGVRQNETYGQFQEQMDMFNRAFAQIMMEGDAKGRVFTFPIPTYNIDKNFDWENPNHDFIWKMTGKYGIPYFSNFVNSDMNPEDARSMCCRLRLDNRELKRRGGGLFGANPLTGSIGVVTINLPRIGYLAKDEENFMAILKSNIEIGCESLIIKRKVLENLTNKNLYPYSKFYLRSVKKKSGFYWDNHFSTIGIIGANEACLNFLKTDIASKKGHDFVLKIMDTIREILSSFQQISGHMFNLEATPAEGTTYRLAKIDKQKYPNILSANDYGEPYYTNSTHLPVNYTDDIFAALNHQDVLQTKYTGGTVIHLFAGNQVSDIKVVKSLIRKVTTNFALPYFTVTPTFSICQSHGYITGEYSKCPQCGLETEVYSRVVGYLRPIKQWNEGKQVEYNQRKPFDVSCLKQKLVKNVA